IRSAIITGEVKCSCLSLEYFRFTPRQELLFQDRAIRCGSLFELFGKLLQVRNIQENAPPASTGLSINACLFPCLFRSSAQGVESGFHCLDVSLWIVCICPAGLSFADPPKSLVSHPRLLVRQRLERARGFGELPQLNLAKPLPKLSLGLEPAILVLLRQCSKPSHSIGEAAGFIQQDSREKGRFCQLIRRRVASQRFQSCFFLRVIFEPVRLLQRLCRLL